MSHPSVGHLLDCQDVEREGRAFADFRGAGDVASHLGHHGFAVSEAETGTSVLKVLDLASSEQTVQLVLVR